MAADYSEVRRLAADLSGLAKRVLDSASRIVEKTAADTVADAQALVPVRTGNLRASIGYEVTRTASSVAAEVGPTASYGHYVEFGTSRMGPRPYMGPAFTRRRDLFVRAMSQVKAQP